MKLIIKRIFDILCSLTALILLSPLFFVIAIGIKLSSPGPVLYKAQRVKKNGVYFYMYKFRSMHAVKGNGEGTFIAEEKRIFPLGAFIRKSKMDELPQLLNILKGDLSIVGPRPFNASSVDAILGKKYIDVLRINPGLTSYASLFDYKHGELFLKDNGQYMREIQPVKLELELYYVNNWTLLGDLKLIFQTCIVIVRIVLGKKEFPYTALETEARRNAGLE